MPEIINIDNPTQKIVNVEVGEGVRIFNRTLKELGQRIPELNVPFAKQITRNRKKEVS